MQICTDIYLYRVVIKFGDIRACTVLRKGVLNRLCGEDLPDTEGEFACTDVAKFNYHPVYIIPFYEIYSHQ